MPNFRKAIVAILCGKSAAIDRCVISSSPIKITISCNQNGRLETLEFPSPRKFKYTAADNNDYWSDDLNIVQQPKNTIRTTSV